MNKSSIRYAAELAYKLCIMRGIYSSKQLGCLCVVLPQSGFVVVKIGEQEHNVRIAKAWSGR